jgi:serine/threonine protein kinase/Tfp pilus assembly protein PilF
MSETRHERISRIFLEAADLPPTERAVYLERACGADANLREEVVALLDRDDRQAVVDHPLVDDDVREAFDHLAAEAPAMPSQLQDYQVVSVLGTGGMATVYRARQASPERDVALKVIRPGYLSDSIARRFEHEAQILGRLQHPGIAQIFEAGTATAGGETQPFIAMEFIDGVTLTAYVRREQLGMRARLELFLAVCDAVQHAHQRGIIHRDLKPGNIMVNRAGRVKVLDFGVARVTDADVKTTTLETQAGQLLGTIPYMSPEQVAGDPLAIDIRTDVYALGTILYELLADKPPLDLEGKSILHAVQIIQHVAPPPLRQHDRYLSGDLETIVRRALEKDRIRRYGSVSDLAADVRRYLRHEPIIARPPTSFYLLRKFAQRNTVLVSVGLVSLLVLLLGAGGTTYGLWKARQERDLAIEAREDLKEAVADAKHEATRAKTISTILTRMLYAPNPMAEIGFGAHDVTVLEMLDRQARDLDEMVFEQPDIEAEVRTILGVTYKSLGRFTDAQEHLRQALELDRQHFGPRHRRVARCMRELGTTLAYQGEYDAGIALLEEALQLMEEIDEPHVYERAMAAGKLGWAHAQTRRFEQAVTYLRQTDELLAQVVPQGGYISPNNVEEQRASAKNNLAFAYRGLGEPEAAEDLYRQAAQVYRNLYGDDHVLVGMTENNIARLLYDRGAVAEAETRYRHALTIFRKYLGPHHNRTADVLNNLAMLLYDIPESRAEAVEMFREGLEICRRLFGEDHLQYIVALNNWAFVLRDEERFSEAETHYRRVSEFYVHHDPTPAWRKAAARYNIATCLWPQSQFEEAEEILVDVLAEMEQLFPPQHPRVGKTRAELVEMYEAWGRPEDAARHRQPPPGDDQATP